VDGIRLSGQRSSVGSLCMYAENLFASHGIVILSRRLCFMQLISVKFQHKYLKWFCLGMCEVPGAEYSYCEVRAGAVYEMLRMVSNLFLYR
jgi:hypothetical protein